MMARSNWHIKSTKTCYTGVLLNIHNVVISALSIQYEMIKIVRSDYKTITIHYVDIFIYEHIYMYI